MIIIKFYSHIFYRLKNYYNLWQAFLVFNTILLLNIMSFFLLYASITHNDIHDLWFLSTTNDYFYDRFEYGVKRVGPLFFFTYTLSVIFKKKLQIYYVEFSDEPLELKKKRNLGMTLYLIFTGLFFVFSLISTKIF